MTWYKKTAIRQVLLFMALVGFVAHPVFAQSLYEKYTTASQSDLEPETSQMGKQLAKTFSATSINAKRQKIDFAKYYSNLKKLTLYGTKLAAYSEYEKDLQFAKDNEIFKGLPEDISENQGQAAYLSKKDFIGDKYLRMKKNVEEEIDTYVDLIMVSLDICEYLTEYDLSELLSNPAYSDKIRHFQHSEEFQTFQTRRNRLALGWPELEARIAAQLALWGDKPASPDEPLISPIITGAL